MMAGMNNMNDFILTLTAAGDNLSPDHFAAAQDHGFETTGDLIWLTAGTAADIALTARPPFAAIQNLRAALAIERIDVFVTAAKNRRKKLLIADMDSTIVAGETLDELAAHAGLKDKIAVITARAMNGELDFKDALRERVALLEGLPESAVAQTLAATHPNPGAEIFVQTMKQNAATCVLVSGGFTLFTAAFSKSCGFDFHHGNTLEIENGVLTGRVTEPILDKDSKVDFLQHYVTENNLTTDDVLAIGDGANDLPMLRLAGLGIGYHAKPVVQNEIENCVVHGDLSTALYAQGLVPGV